MNGICGRDGRMKWNIAVCDDHRTDADRMEAALTEYLENAGMQCEVRIFQSGKALEYEVEDGQLFDLLFLDIELGDENGLLLAKRLQDRLPAALLIFVSSYEKYVYDSFKLQPFRFLPKRCLTQMLPETLSAATAELKRREDRFLLVENGQGVEKIPLEAITYIRQQGKYACIAKVDGSLSKVRRTLKSLAEELPQKQFLQIDRGYLCNVTKVTQLKNDKLTLITGEELYVSSGRMRELKDKVMEYWIGEKRI